MPPPPNPFNQPAYPQGQGPYAGQNAYLPPQAPRGAVSLDAISEAWRLLSPNIGPWLLAVVIYFGANYALSGVRGGIQSLGNNGGSPIWSVLALMVQLVSFVVQQYLLGGLAKMAIETVRTRVADINQMWSVTDLWGRLALSGLLQALFYGIAALPGLFVLGRSVFLPLYNAGIFNAATMRTGRPPALSPALVSGMFGGIAGGVLLIIALSIPVAALLFLAPSILVDRKVGPWTATAASFNALKSQFFPALLFLFVLGLLNLAGFMVCCVGLLVTWPISQIAIAIVYRDLFGLGEAAPQATIVAPPPIANPNF